MAQVNSTTSHMGKSPLVSACLQCGITADFLAVWTRTRTETENALAGRGKIPKPHLCFLRRLGVNVQGLQADQERFIKTQGGQAR